MRRGEEGGRVFPRTTHVYCTSPENSIKKVRRAPRKCRALRGTQTHACLPTVFLDALRTARRGQLPADDATRPREQKDTQPRHTDRLSNLQSKRWTPKRKNVAPGSCLLRTASGQQTGNPRPNQLEVRTQSGSKWAKHPTVAVKELMDRVVSYLTSMRSTGKWSHRQWSSRAIMKHHDTSNTTTIKTLPQRPIVSFPRRSTTSGDAKNFQRDALFLNR